MWDPATIVVDAADCSLPQALQPLNPPVDDLGRLVLYSGTQAGRSVSLQRGRLCIGRAADAWLRLDHPGLSRWHAELQVSDQGAVLHDHVWRLAVVDAGTGVFNRRHLPEQLARELPLARHGRQPISVVCYDLDRFKQVNDQHGHGAGDHVLSESAARVHCALDGQGLLCRQGGEEFAVLLPGLGLAEAAALAERLRMVVAERPFSLPGTPATAAVQQTISLGVAEWQPGMDQGTDMLAAADAMLYRAKQAGRNRVCA